MIFNGDCKNLIQLEIDSDDTAQLASILEAVLFAGGEAISVKKLADIAGVGVRDVRRAIAALNSKYAESGGLTLIESEGTCQLVTKKEFSDYIDRLFDNPKRKGLSNAALEVLAVVAVRQPVTRAEIEEMRGVNSDAVVQQLIKKELIYCSGKSDKLGSPNQYSTTEKFLEVFELANLSELPPIEDFIML